MRHFRKVSHAEIISKIEDDLRRVGESAYAYDASGRAHACMRRKNRALRARSEIHLSAIAIVGALNAHDMRGAPFFVK